MISYVLTERARSDLFDIWSYIAQHNEAAADRVEAEIYAGCAFLATCRFAGRIRRDLTSKPVFFWPLTRYPNYILAYDPDRDPLEIVRVLHGAMNRTRRI